MRKRFVTVLVLLSLCASVSASSVKAKYTGMDPSDTVRVVLNGSGRTVYSGTSWFQVQQKYYEGDFQQELALLPDTFWGYCIDFTQSIHFGNELIWQLETLENAPVPGAGMGDERAKLLSWLWDQHDGENGVELQLGIWEVLSENLEGENPLTLTDGDFHAPKDWQYDEDLVEGWLGDLNAMDWSVLSRNPNLLALTHANKQDFMVGVILPPPPAVPEPLTILGAAMGCSAIGGYLRRRRR